MPKTRNELIEQALFKLLVLDAGDTVSAEDQAAVDAVIDPLLAELAARDVVYVAYADAIPDEIFDPLALRLAMNIASAFGKAAVGNTPVTETTMEAVEERIKTVVRMGRGSLAPLRADRALLYNSRGPRTFWR